MTEAEKFMTRFGRLAFSTVGEAGTPQPCEDYTARLDASDAVRTSADHWNRWEFPDGSAIISAHDSNVWGFGFHRSRLDSGKFEQSPPPDNEFAFVYWQEDSYPDDGGTRWVPLGLKDLKEIS